MKVEKTDTCWLWTATRNMHGYGMFGIERRNRLAHRIAYEWQMGPIPAGLECDHICRVRHCVNPAHLQLVTHRENVLRGNGRTALNALKTICPAGHAYSPENTYVGRRGGRFCRACGRLATQRYQARTTKPRTQRSKPETHCHRGHPFDEANTYYRSNGTRECRMCHRERHRRVS